MPKLIAQRAFRYAELPLDKGDEFHASERDARTLVVIGSATYAIEDDVTPKRQKRKYKRRDLQAEA